MADTKCPKTLISRKISYVTTSLRLTSGDESLLESFLNSYEYVLTEEIETGDTDDAVLEQEFSSNSTILDSFASIENEVIGDLPVGFLIDLKEKEPTLKTSIKGNVISIELKKTKKVSSYYYWNGTRYRASASYLNWVGHPRNGKRNYKTASFNGNVFTTWRIKL